MYSYAEPSPFPPSFDGNPWAYAFGLFGDVVAAALALTMLLAYVFEARRNREIHRRLKNPLPEVAPIPPWTPLYIYRVGNISMLAFIVLRALPDAVWMLAWGEVSEPVIRAMLATDLVLDGLAIGPLVMAAFCWAWGRQTIPQKLIHGADAAVQGRLPWKLIWRNGKIVLLVSLIAIGVTYGKASA